MKFRVIKSALVDAVSQVSKAVSSKTTIPILTGIKIAVDEDRAHSDRKQFGHHHSGACSRQKRGLGSGVRGKNR